MVGVVFSVVRARRLLVGPGPDPTPGAVSAQARTVLVWLASRAYHFVDNMVDAHCVRDEGGFTVHWLVAFHCCRVRVRVCMNYRLCQRC